MKRRVSIPRMFLALLLVVGLAGCATTHVATPTDEERVDLGWFTHSLQDEGVFITEAGLATLSVPAQTSRRLVLNDRDVVDVYLFHDEDVARDKAYTFAGLYPRTDVYVKDELVVVRYTERDSGLSLTLFELLGTTL